MIAQLAVLGLGVAAWAEDAAGTADYGRGFEIENADGTYRLGIGARMQLRYSVGQILVDGEDSETFGAFVLRRGRVTLAGHAHSKNIRYKLQVGWDKDAPVLKDMYFDLGPKTGVQLRAGQMKMPFSRQQLNSSSKLDLVDRAITDKAFLGGRDIGLMVHNGVTSGEGVEASLGLFNGNGDKASVTGDVVTDDDGAMSLSGVKIQNEPSLFHPEIVGRVAYGSEGLAGYDEIDWKGGDLRGGVGLNAGTDLDLDDTDDGHVRAGVDGLVRVDGLSVHGGGYLLMVQDGADFGSQTMSAVGGHGEVNKLIAEQWAVVARGAHVAWTEEEIGTTEARGGLAYYHKKHKVKLDTDAGVILEDEETEIVLRSQLQISF